MELQKIRLDKLYFDTDNLRYDFDFDFIETTPEDKLKSRPQKTVYNLLKRDIGELVDSILSNDFIYIEQIIVQKVNENAFYVIEGNRRLASLRYIYETEDIEDLPEKLQDIYHNGIDVRVVHEEDNYDPDMLMGMRHISGVKHWKGFSKAKLIVKLRDKKNMSFKEIGSRLGERTNELIKNYYSFKLLARMEEAGYDYVDLTKYFTLMNGAITSSDFKNWLDFDEQNIKFNNTHNAERFYSWIVGLKNEDTDEYIRPISSPTDLRQVAKILNDDDALNILEETGDVREATNSSLQLRHRDVKKAIYSISNRLQDINAKELLNMDKETEKVFREIQDTINTYINVLDNNE